MITPVPFQSSTHILNTNASFSLAYTFLPMFKFGSMCKPKVQGCLGQLSLLFVCMILVMYSTFSFKCCYHLRDDHNRLCLFCAFYSSSQDRLVVALGVDLFAVNDEKFMDMFVAPGAIDILQDEKQSLQKRQKILHSCLNEFKSVARAL